MKSRIALAEAWVPVGAVLIYLALALHQLALPGLHYDEAKEAGVNAMEILLRQDVHAFRSAGLQAGTLFLPIMVQDYIGALNVYLALPWLALVGTRPEALRLLAVACGLVTLVLTWRLGTDLVPEEPGEARRHRRETGPQAPGATRPVPVAGAVAALLLALSPSFVFWSRQGVFVTNVATTLAVATVWAGFRYWQEQQKGRMQPRFLYLFALLAGLGLWTKLLFVWILGAMAVTLAVAWLMTGPRSTVRPQTKVAHLTTEKLPARSPDERTGLNIKPSTARHGIIAILLFLLGIAPLVLFNQQTGGTLKSILANLGSSYYGVNNAAFLSNLVTRLAQLATLLKGDHFWYLGGIFANVLSPWIGGGMVLAALLATWVAPQTQWQARLRWRRRLMLALLFVALLVVQSSFTVSDLFITHYAIIQPFVLLLVGLAAECLLRAWMVLRQGRSSQTAESRRASDRAGGQSASNHAGTTWFPGRLLALNRGASLLLAAGVIALLAWVAADLRSDLRYHAALASSGGQATHSDAVYRLSDWLDQAARSTESQSAGPGTATQPLALDWGIEAPVRYLTANRVRPVEIFGYDQLDAPDAAFEERLAPFLAAAATEPDRRYLVHVPEDTIFRGRRDALEVLAGQQGLKVVEEAAFNERSGRPVLLVLRLEPAQAPPS